jgi:hypothetical protein
MEQVVVRNYMDVNEDNTVHLNTHLGNRTTLLLHLQMFMNVSIWFRLAVIIRYGPMPSGRIWLEVITRWTLIYEYAKQHIKTARKGLLRFFQFAFSSAHREFIWSWSLTGIVRCYGDLVGGVAYHNIWFCANCDCTFCPSGWINSTGQGMDRTIWKHNTWNKITYPGWTWHDDT